MVLKRSKGKLSLFKLIKFIDYMAKMNKALRFSFSLDRAGTQWILKLSFINITMPSRDKKFEWHSKYNEESLDKFLYDCVQSIKDKVDLLDLNL